MDDHDLVAAGGGGGGGDDGAQCSNYPYHRKTSSPGGICALCLQDKLGKLVSSSSSSFIPTSSTSPSPSFASASSTLTLQPHLHAPSDVTKRHPRNADVYPSRRGSHFPFLHSHRHPKSSSSSSFSSNDVGNAILKRSQSTANEGLTPRRRGFWSFLHVSSTRSKQDRPKVGPGPGPAQTSISATTEAQLVTAAVDNDDKTAGLHERKVSRSRSIGCGSRSFSGDFFERISTGFADCALRRIESNREGRRSTSSARDIVKDRVRCGGLFGGFIITSSSSSSSSSSYLTAMGDDHNANAKPNGPTSTPGAGPLVHGRSRSWGWALASPMRVFTKPIIASTTTIKHSNSSVRVGGANNNGNGTTKVPNLADIPSLLSVR